MPAYENHACLSVIDSAIAVFQRQKSLAEHCFQQLDDERFFRELYPGHNSVGVIAQHLGGNMTSRWSDFLTTDGEKPWRDREREFHSPPEGADLHAERERIMTTWERGWATLFAALQKLDEEDLDKPIKIRGVDHSVALAILRQVDHYAHHTGQIATVARGLVGTDRWRWYSPAPGKTTDYNASLNYDADARS